MDREQFLKHFESSQAFNAFCLGMSKQQIRKLSTDDWTSIYYGINYLVSKGGYASATEFVTKHSKAFQHLYSNYTPDKKKSRAIKKFAYSIADKLSTSKEFADFYYKIDVWVAASSSTNYKLAALMRSAMYQEFLGDKVKAGLLKPFVRVVNRDNKEPITSGYYKAGGLFGHAVVVKRGMANFCNTTAHEIYHSLQHISFATRTKFLRKIGVRFNYDKKMAELYRLNNAYYFDLKDGLRAYKKQPLEYDARLFATCFERRLRKNLRASENNWGMVYQTTQMLREVDIYDQNVEYSEKSICLSFYAPNKQTQSILGELKTRHLQQAQLSNIEEGMMVLYIPANMHNIVKLNKLFNRSRKVQDDATRRAFIKESFPITYNKFFATEKERMQYQPNIKKIAIKRLGGNGGKL